MEKLVELLIDKNKTMSTMESCTGGGVANAITNIEGASEILKFSAVTYSNEYKIKMGVSEEIINKYSVYSMECADEMCLNISMFSNSSLGVGITGKLNRCDINNDFGDNNKVFISIYDRDNDCFFRACVTVVLEDRVKNKELVCQKVSEMLINILKDNY
jgi:PncC family amidohydrolase